VHGGNEDDPFFDRRLRDDLFDLAGDVNDLPFVLRGEIKIFG
jgi:hypothetical protein